MHSHFGKVLADKYYTKLVDFFMYTLIQKSLNLTIALHMNNIVTA